MSGTSGNTLLIDPFAGASGDMLLCALVDAGADERALGEELSRIPALSRLVFATREVTKGAFRARTLDARLPEESTHRGLADVLSVVESATHLSEWVRSCARDAFTRLATVEARLHGTTVDKVHFHEVGALDAIMDVVGFFTAAHQLGVHRFRYTGLQLGEGTAQSAHGEIPVPAPATLELLEGHAVRFSHRRGEQITPTAATIIASVFEPIGPDESITPASFGYGAGTREDEQGLPGVLRVVVGKSSARANTLSVIRCTIDDMSPEMVAHATAVLFETGALEVYVTPVFMKKNRSGVELTVLCSNADVDRLASAVLTHTSTLGVRISREGRVELSRRSSTVTTPVGEVEVKVARLPDGTERMTPEFESCRVLAAGSGHPIDVIYRMAHTAWRDRCAID